MTTLVYLKQELQFNLKEWQELPEKDKADLRAAAETEMRLKGIEVTQAK